MGPGWHGSDSCHPKARLHSTHSSVQPALYAQLSALCSGLEDPLQQAHFRMDRGKELEAGCRWAGERLGTMTSMVLTMTCPRAETEEKSLSHVYPLVRLTLAVTAGLNTDVF